MTRKLPAILTLAVGSIVAFGGSFAATAVAQIEDCTMVSCHDDEAGGCEPCDLYLCDLFRTGWDEHWEEPSKSGRANRTRLFRTRHGFFEREFRVDFRFANNADGGEVDEYELEPELEVPFNRRLMVELEGEQVWEFHDDGTSETKHEWAVRFDLQLIDTCNSAVLLDLKVAPPAEDGERTKLGVLLAGFRDLGNRVGLQWHLGSDFLLGSAPSDEPDSKLTYALALTKTITEDVPCFEHFTIFVETFGMTELGGAGAGDTVFSILPGAKWELGREIYFGLGCEIPLSGPRPYDEIFHFQLVKEM